MFWVVVAVETVVVVSGITKALQEINCSRTDEGIPIYRLGRFRVSPEIFSATAEWRSTVVAGKDGGSGEVIKRERRSCLCVFLL